MRLTLSLLLLVFANASRADYNEPRYEWPEKLFVCSDFERQLTDAEFIDRALAHDLRSIWQEGDPPPIDVAADIRRAVPECCTVVRRDHPFSLQLRYTGWFDRNFGQPTIMVSADFEGRFERRPDHGNITGDTYLMDPCGRVGERFGPRYDLVETPIGSVRE